MLSRPQRELQRLVRSDRTDRMRHPHQRWQFASPLDGMSAKRLDKLEGASSGIGHNVGRLGKQLVQVAGELRFHLNSSHRNHGVYLPFLQGIGDIQAETVIMNLAHHHLDDRDVALTVMAIAEEFHVGSGE
jgi:hypothetical protein